MYKRQNEHRVQVDQQISEIKHESQELSTKLRSEAREVVNEEMETFQMQVRENLEKGEQTINQTQETVAQEIKTINKKIIINNKKHEEQISQYRAEVSREVNEVGGQLTLVKEDMRMRLLMKVV